MERTIKGRGQEKKVGLGRKGKKELRKMLSWFQVVHATFFVALKCLGSMYAAIQIVAWDLNEWGSFTHGKGHYLVLWESATIIKRYKTEKRV